MSPIEQEIARRVERGWRVESHAGTTATLVKPKRFSLLVFFLLLGVFYIPFYIAKREERVFLSEADGSVSARSSKRKAKGKGGSWFGALPLRWQLGSLGALAVALLVLVVTNGSESGSSTNTGTAAQAAGPSGPTALDWATACKAAIAVALSEAKSPSTVPGGSGSSACALIQNTTAKDADGNVVWTFTGTLEPQDGSKTMQYVVEVVDVGDGTTTRTKLVSLGAAPPPSVAPVPSGPKLSGYGALSADWAAQPGGTSRFSGVQRVGGRVVTFSMDFPGRGVDWTVARDEVLRLLPSDAQRIEEVTRSDCKQLLYRSATLGAVFAQHDAAQAREGDRTGNANGHVAVSLWSERATYNGRNVDTAFVTTGLNRVNPNGC